MDADGRGKRNLTQNKARDDSPAWSPDGRKIAFVSSRDGYLDVYVMKADGSGQRKLTRNQARDEGPVWSPDGRKIAFVSDRDGNFEIYVMNADGSNQRNLTQNRARDDGPVWSPDGRRIVFVSNRNDTLYNCRTCDPNLEIYVMNADGSGKRNLTRNEWSDTTPVWSPDGRKIAFVSNRGQPFEVGADPSGAAVFVMNADGSRQRSLTPHQAIPPPTGCGDCGLYDTSPAWSPDGRKIAFTSSRDGNGFEIYVMAANGSDQQRLTRDQDVGFGAAWSPNGKQIAFYSIRDGSIYVMNADGSKSQKLAVGWEYAWSPRRQR